MANSRSGSEGGRAGQRAAAIVAIAVLSLVAISCGPRVGGPAPPFTLDDGAGAKISLSGMKGSSVVVSFWATWCGPCRMELPDLVRLQQEMEGKVHVLLISRETRKETQGYLKEQGIFLTSLADEAGTVHGAYGVSAYPTLFVIDAAGKIKQSHVGYAPGSYDRLREEVAAASS